MKIKWIHHHLLRKSEHLEFYIEARNVIQSATNVHSRIADLMPAFDAAFEMESKVTRKTLKSDLTDEIEKSDRQRNHTFRGLVYTHLAALHHYDAEMAKAAERIKTVFDAYGNLSDLPRYEETAAMQNFLQELGNLHAKDLAILKMDGWINRLKTENAAVRNLIEERYTEGAAKLPLSMKKCRAETDRAYMLIVGRINTLIGMDGEAPYATFVNTLNRTIDNFNHLLAQRQGRAKAGKPGNDSTIP